MPEEDRVFDVSRPGRKAPSATGRPVIVGHHPMMSDPMVKESGEDDKEFLGEHHQPTIATQIHITDAADNEPVAKEPAAPAPSIEPESSPADYEESHEVPEITPQEQHSDIPAMDPNLETYEPSSRADDEPTGPPGIITPPTGPKFGSKLAAEADKADHSPHHSHHQPPRHPRVEPLPVAPLAKKKSRWPLVILILLLILIAVYLALDSGLIKNNLNLPVHFFKQKPQSSSVQTPLPPPKKAADANTPAVPDGFSKYTLSGTDIAFDAPTAWGKASSTTEPGYSVRGGSNKTDGTYAYTVDFPNNKDVEMVVTSSQYLPAARATQYYDFLQWCVGTSDSKIYLSKLQFTTTKGVDTPTTIACDQGPVDATKLNSTTIYQHDVKDTQGKSLGDIYTLNLSDKDLPVLRVKDTAMTNGDNIKTLLGTVQVTTNVAD